MNEPLVIPNLERTVTVVEGDEGLLEDEEAALNDAEADCATSGTCSLAATQHLQIRVILMSLFLELNITELGFAMEKCM